MRIRMFSSSLGIVLVILAIAVTIGPPPARAEIFGTVHGIVHDPQHRPIQDAAVDLKAQHSDWVQHQKTNGDGEFDFSTVPWANTRLLSLWPAFNSRSRMSLSGLARVLCCIFNWSWRASRKKQL